MECTKAIRSMVHSLERAKSRRETGLFIAQGTKCVIDTLQSFKIYAIFATPEWLDQHIPALPADATIVPCHKGDIKEMTTLATTPDVIAVYHIPPHLSSTPSASRLSIALDCIQDPGNLGTIIRLASWMGVKDIYCSDDCVDLYNPKVVQSTMGAVAHVNITYCNLHQLIARAIDNNIPVYGTFLQGNNIYQTTLTDRGIILMGNEGNGIRPDIATLVSHRIFIPPFPPDQRPQDSLNVATATAIILAEFRRRAQWQN